MKQLEHVAVSTLPEEAQKVLAWLHSSTSEIIARGDDVTPMLFFRKDGKLCVGSVAGFMGSGEGKDALADIIQKLTETPDVDFVVMVTEAWSLVAKDGKEAPTEGISDHPDRTEIVMFNMRYEGKQYMAYADISRDPDVLGELFIPAAELGGRFAKPVLQ